MSDQILHDHTDDGIDRRGFLKCMAWAGTGALWAVQDAGAPGPSAANATRERVSVSLPRAT